MGKNHYELLGVSKTATTEEIERGKNRATEDVEKRVKKDSFLGKLQFMAIEEAYNTLSKLDTRTSYDKKLVLEATGKTRSNGMGLLLFTFGITVIVVAIANPNLAGVATTVFVVMGIVAVLISNLKLREPIPIDKETGFQTNDGESSRKVIVIVGIIVAITLAGFSSSKAPSDSGKAGTKPSQASTPKNSNAVLDSCFIAGKIAAQYYVANFVELASNDLLASDLMPVVCTKKGESAPDPNSCSNTCKLGFKAALRNALK